MALRGLGEGTLDSSSSLRLATGIATVNGSPEPHLALCFYPNAYITGLLAGSAPSALIRRAERAAAITSVSRSVALRNGCSTKA